MTLVLDVETLPLVASLAMPYPDAERPYPANYKAEEAIAKWRAADRIAWQEARVKECSLSPRLGRICCAGWAVDEPVTFVAESEAAEATLLTAIWDSMSASYVPIVTFNGSFDLRFLVIRSIVNGITPNRGTRVTDWFRRYSTSPHFDCRAVLTGWDDRQSGKLTEWCSAFGIPVPENGTTGADIYSLAQAGNWDAISAHCLDDVRMTRALYQRISPMFT